MDIKTAHNLQDKQRTEDIEIDETITFEEMFLSEAVLNGLHACGYIRPSPIQLKAIPLGRCGLDLIVQAKSGTGKTCVFAVVALEMISVKAKTTQVLVIAPTREIAVQIGQVVNSIGSSLPELKAYTFIGGINLLDDKAKLSCCHIAIGTPGRLNQLVSLGHLNLTNVRLLVLDEADQLLTGQFKSSILELVKTSPFNKQILACSATYPREVTEFLDQYMRSPSHVRLGKESPALIGVKQFARLLPDHPQPHARHKLKFRELLSILSSISFNQCLVFSNSQLRAESICNQLKSSGWPAAFLTGGQVQTERLQSYFALCSYKCRILVSTDLSARGLDSEHVNLVINLDIPMDQATYLHRIGRAGRFGSIGVAISIVCEGMEWEAMRAVINITNVAIKILPERFDTDFIQNNYEYLETVERLDEEIYAQFLENLSKRKPKLNSNNTEPHVDSLIEKSKKLLKEKEIKTSKQLNIHKKSNTVMSKLSSNQTEEKNNQCIQTVKETMHDYAKEAKFIFFSPSEIKSEIPEDVENHLQFDIPHLSIESLIKKYPSTHNFTALENYLNNIERYVNSETNNSNIKIQGNSFNSIEALQNVLDGNHSLENLVKETFDSKVHKNDNLENSYTSFIKHKQKDEISDVNNSLINISVASADNSVAIECEDKIFDITGKMKTSLENKLKINSISSSEEVNVDTVPKKKVSSSFKQKNYSKNTGFGEWKSVNTSNRASNKKDYSQLCHTYGTSSLDSKFNAKHLTDNERYAHEDMFEENSFYNHIDNDTEVNVSYPCSFNANSNFSYNYNQYCLSTNMYVEAAQKLASMMEYARSLGKMSAWIAQDNNNRLLYEKQCNRKSKNLRPKKTSDSSK